MEKINILCQNDNNFYEVELGKTLKEIKDDIKPTIIDNKTGEEFPVLAALVDNALKELDYRIVYSHLVNFVGYNHPEGRRCYLRSLIFILQAAVREIFPDKKLIVDYSLPGGIYSEIHELHKQEDGRPQVYFITDAEIDRLSNKMKEIVAADIPFKRVKTSVVEACEIFEANNQPDKAALQRSSGKFVCSVYYMGDVADTLHGPLVPSSGYITQFNLMGFSKGFCIQFPVEGTMKECTKMRRQDRMAKTLSDHADWCNILGIKAVGSLNNAISTGHAKELINLSEALHERQYADIADKIFERRGNVKIVFIAGPSSSGKTSSSKRIALQCKVLGLNPKVIELDNYFRNREDTPKDENGEYDFECLGAMNTELLREHLNALLAGEKVEIPYFDFQHGKSIFNGNFMQLGEKDILIMEGIHALNPAMVQGVDNSRIFRVYASALTSLSIDENDLISTTDNRLLRRIIRDNHYRGHNPEQTIMRWPSVKKGENQNIFPYQENADAYFNSALIFELPMLKYYAEPLLRRIPANSPAYTEALRLLKFLGYIVALTPDEIEAIPPTSIMREFIGGQIL